MLNSTEHEISTVHKTKMLTKIKTVLALKLSDVLIMLKNVKMPTFNDIFRSIKSMVNVKLSYDKI